MFFCLRVLDSSSVSSSLRMMGRLLRADTGGSGECSVMTGDVRRVEAGGLRIGLRLGGNFLLQTHSFCFYGCMLEGERRLLEIVDISEFGHRTFDARRTWSIHGLSHSGFNGEITHYIRSFICQIVSHLVLRAQGGPMGNGQGGPNGKGMEIG